MGRWHCGRHPRAVRTAHSFNWRVNRRNTSGSPGVHRAGCNRRPPQGSGRINPVLSNKSSSNSPWRIARTVVGSVTEARQSLSTGRKSQGGVQAIGGHSPHSRSKTGTTVFLCVSVTTVASLQLTCMRRTACAGSPTISLRNKSIVCPIWANVKWLLSFFIDRLILPKSAFNAENHYCYDEL